MTPSYFRVRSAAEQVWPRVPTTTASSIWAMFLDLERSQWLDPREIVEHQLAQLRSLLNHCVRNVPYYRRLLAAHAIRPESIQSMEDLRRIPRLERRTYREQYKESQMWAGSIPAGMREAGKAHTSGATGVPIELKQTNVVQLWWHAFLLRDHLWSGIDPLGKLASIRATGKTGDELARLMQGVEAPYWSQSLSGVIETGPASFMDIHQLPRRQLDWLVGVDPDYLLSFPSNLECLAGLAAESGIRFERLRAIQTISETLSDSTRQRIETGFGVPVKNTYSCSEAGYLASPCPSGAGLHVHSENVILEVLDAKGDVCSPGETGRVVITTLQNFLCPFVRYEIGDEAEVGPERCPCGRGLPLLTRVLGKERPVLQLPDGRLKHSSALTIELWRAGGFHQFQVRQLSPDTITVRLVPDRTWTTTHSDRIVAACQNFFEGPVQVEIDAVDHLELPPGGKLQCVIRDFDPAPP